MNSLTSFVKLSDNETILQEWEVLNDKGGFHATDIATIVILVLIAPFALEFVMRLMWELGAPSMLYRAVYWGLIIGGVILFFMTIVSRPSQVGQVVLSNWRLIYYEHGEGALSSYQHKVFTLNLEDVVGVHSDYQEGLWGTRNLAITVHTKHKDGIAFHAGHSQGILSRLPLIGVLFRRNTMGSDVSTFVNDAFRLIQENQERLENSSVSY